MTDAEKIKKLQALIGSIMVTLTVVHFHLPDKSRDALMLESIYTKIKQVMKEIGA